MCLCRPALGVSETYCCALIVSFHVTLQTGGLKLFFFFFFFFVKIRFEIIGIVIF